MHTYEFEYTKTWDTVAALLLTLATFIATEFIGTICSLDFILTFLIGAALAVLLFQFFKKKLVRFCMAKLSPDAVVFTFEDNIKTIQFSELTSYRFYDDQNGAILYLNSGQKKFKLVANGNFCNIATFKLFADAMISELEAYKYNCNPALKEEGSIYASKGFRYFLLVSILFCFVVLAIVNKHLRIFTFIFGVVWLLVVWAVYRKERHKKQE